MLPDWSWSDGVLERYEQLARFLDLTEMGRQADRPLASIEVQGQVYKVRVKGCKSRGSGGIRGCVSGFSREARKRMLELTERLDLQAYQAAGGNLLFLSLTYPKSYPSDRIAKRLHLRAFFARLEYHYRESSGLWRLEHQRRGAPHFHLILLGLERQAIMLPILRQWWAEIIGYKGKSLQVDVQALNDWRQCFGYVAKYCAKVAPTEVVRYDGGAANFWGRWAGSDNGAGIESADPSATLDNVAYCQNTSSQHDEVIGRSRGDTLGRVWGVFNRAKLPLAQVFLLRNVIAGQWLNRVKRAGNGFLRAEWRKRDVIQRAKGKRAGRLYQIKGDKRGFTLFCDNPGRWLEWAMREVWWQNTGRSLGVQLQTRAGHKQPGLTWACESTLADVVGDTSIRM